MAISAGNYIIRSALDENIVITGNNQSAKGSAVSSGAFSDSSNTCYWKVQVVDSSYNRIYSITAGSTNGNIMAASVAANKKITMGAYASGTGRWLAVSSGNTMVVDGVSVGTYFLKAQANQNLYLTAPANGGQLYLATAMGDTTQQEWYFEASTYRGYASNGLVTPTELRIYGGKNYFIESAPANYSFAPQWKSSSSGLIYEIRYRTRMFNEFGIAAGWGNWTSWTAYQASKVPSKNGYYYALNAAVAPSIDNSTYSRASIQVSVRITSAANMAGYNKTGSVTHGASCTETFNAWVVPTFSISAAECTQYGISITYTSDYKLAGNKIKVISIRDGAKTIVSNYTATDLDYQGSFTVPWDVISDIPANGDSLVITAELTESNNVVKKSTTSTVTVSYDADAGMSFTPTYTVTARDTIEAKISAYDYIECYMLGTDLRGNEVWILVEETASSNASYRTFEVIPPFGQAPTIMWVVRTTVGSSQQWGTKQETLANTYKIASNACEWNWVDDDMIPRAFFLKYQKEKLIQPDDAVTLPANEFVTTGRDYPVFRYSKSLKRNLDVGGIVLNSETSANCTKADAEALEIANHTVYREPNGKWYQTALQNVKFNREREYYGVQISQEAESR